MRARARFEGITTLSTSRNALHRRLNEASSTQEASTSCESHPLLPWGLPPAGRVSCTEHRTACQEGPELAAGPAWAPQEPRYPFHMIWAGAFTHAPLCLSLPAPPLCKSTHYTDLHNSCILSTHSCQAFRLHKAILPPLMESKIPGSCCFFSLNIKPVSKLYIGESVAEETKCLLAGNMTRSKVTLWPSAMVSPPPAFYMVASSSPSYSTSDPATRLWPEKAEKDSPSP